MHVSPHKVLAFHSALHITSLTTGDAVTAVMPGAWLKHVRSMSTTFARSAKRKFSFGVAFAEVLAELDALAIAMGDVIQTHTWKMTFPKRYCAARWTGLETSADSIVLAWAPLARMKQTLIEDNYGPPREDSDSESEESSSDEEEEEGEEEKRGTPCLDSLLLLDRTHSGNPDASARKRVVLLDPRIGVTDLNWGFNSLMSAFLKPVGLATTRLQTVHQPIQHRVARILRKMRRDVASFPKELREPFTAWRKW